MTILHHGLGYSKNDPSGRGTGNSRKDKGRKKLKSGSCELEFETSRDRNSSFEPHLVKKGQRRFDGFDDKIISLYSRGMTVWEIRGHLKDMYGVEGSPTLTSNVTAAVWDEVVA